MRFERFFNHILFLLLLLSYELMAQGAMNFVNYPGSVSTLGMGEQGAALKNSQDAFTFNPANLNYSGNARLSFFRNPFQFFSSFPLSNVAASFRLKGIGSFGLQYLRHEYGDFSYSSVESPSIIYTYHMYNYALALGYAREISNELSLGLSAKYCREEYGVNSINAILLSGGINYQPELFKKRLSLGFSLMNMGNPVTLETAYLSSAGNSEETSQQYILENKFPVSAMMHLAMNAAVLETGYLSAAVQLGISRNLHRTIVQRGEEKSSFASLIEDWQDFSEDTKIHSGLAFEWKPLDLGNDFSFFQKFYLGSISAGPKVNSADYFTHGAEIGIGYKELCLSAGYAGRWHNIQGYIPLMRPELPWETFQFSLEWNIEKYLNQSSENTYTAPVSKIIITAGTGYNFRKGNLLPNPRSVYEDFKSRNSLSYLLEAAFYMTPNNALVTGFYYTSIPINISFLNPLSSYKWEFGTKYETVGIYSDYRYHPLEALQLLYIQGGPGIVRINPVLSSSPRYIYQASFNAAIGATLYMDYSNLVINPEVSYQLMLVPISAAPPPRLGGENQLTISLKAGYRF